jgi:uncharacterized membrane protein YeiH
MIDFITLCDYSGTFAFAISGIRLASAKQFDWFGEGLLLLDEMMMGIWALVVRLCLL